MPRISRRLLPIALLAGTVALTGCVMVKPLGHALYGSLAYKSCADERSIEARHVCQEGFDETPRYYDAGLAGGPPRN